LRRLMAYGAPTANPLFGAWPMDQFAQLFGRLLTRPSA
jgi:hypothetical protein